MTRLLGFGAVRRVHSTLAEGCTLRVANGFHKNEAPKKLRLEHDELEHKLLNWAVSSKALAGTYHFSSEKNCCTLNTRSPYKQQQADLLEEMSVGAVSAGGEHSSTQALEPVTRLLGLDGFRGV